MAGLGGLIAAALLKVVGDQIGSVLGGQIKLHRNFDNDLRSMKDTLECVEAVLADAEKRAITEKLVLLWLKRLKTAMYAISDMLDDFEATTHKVSRKKKLGVVIPCLTAGPKFKMANKLKKMREHLAEITAQQKDFNFIAGTGAANDQNVINTRKTTSSILKAEIVGRTNEEDKILAPLSMGITEETTFLPIYGVGGLGKTTMAKMIYNNGSRFQDYSRVWVYVSQTFDLNNIGNSIISQLSGSESKHTDREMIHISLRKLFIEKKKILVVLDDLWEGSNFLLDDLKAMLTAEKGNKVVIIVTTRDEGIAKKMSIRPHRLAPLTNDMCWAIIKQKSGFEDKNDKGQFQHIGMDIAMKCGGVGLAAQSLGYLLKSMPTSREWESVRDSEIWALSASDTEDAPSRQVMASLRLSYSSMPLYLKLCFAYCAIFPKGHKIVKDDLIRQWDSLDFIKPTGTSSSRQLGEKYIAELLGLSFLEHSKSSLTSIVHPDDVTFFTMHDLVHDLARSVMDDEILVSSKHNSLEGSNCHYALVDDCSKLSESTRIRALHFTGSAEIGPHDDAFAYAKSVRVLDLSQCSIHKLPDSIGRLKRLRYLNAPRVQDTTIPNGTTSLPKLNHLSLRDSSTILTLPQSIGETEYLTYLDLSGCLGIRELPKSFGKLKKLVHLDLSNCHLVRNVSEFLGSLVELQYLNLSFCLFIGELPESLGVLSKLQYLNLSFSSYIESCNQAEVLGALTKLEYLNLSSRPTSLEQLPELLGSFDRLKYLYLSGCQKLKKLPLLSENHNSLVHLDLLNCWRVNYLPETFDGLTNLQYLNLSGCLGYRYSKCQIDCLMDHLSTLSSLEHLDLSNNLYIKSLPESLGNLRKLHTLNLSDCGIGSVPQSICTSDSLKMLYLNGCWNLSEAPLLSGNSISLPLFRVDAVIGESSSNIVLLQDTNPVELKITQLENVKSAKEAASIKLMEKDLLDKLTLQWTEDAQRFVDDQVLLEKLEPPSSLNELVIEGYNGASLPAWLNQLPNLRKLVLYDMKRVEEWSASDSSDANDLMLPVLDELHIINCPNLRLKSLLLPRARQLGIVNSGNVLLSSWGSESSVSNTESSSSQVVTTTKLYVENCEMPLHQWRLLAHLAGGLTELTMGGCGDLTGTPEIINTLSSLQALKLRRGKEHEELPKWLGELTSLKTMEIHEYAELKELDESIRKLTKLQVLYLYGCKSMSSLPHWLIDLTCLKSLGIWDSKGMRSLPEGIQQLTNLQELTIWKCPELKRWCESEENEMKLAHIKTKKIW